MTQENHGLTELDVLSQKAATILRQGAPRHYQALVVTGPAPAHPATSLKGVTAAELLDRPVLDPDSGLAMLAGLWLWFDELKEAHAISQDLVSPTGSFWHAIVHRREGDFSNAKYWYDRCQMHRVNRLLGAASSGLGNGSEDPVIQRVTAGEWDGYAFVDLVEAVHDKPEDPRHAIAVRLQQAEWQALFHHSVLAAVGSPLD